MGKYLWLFVILFTFISCKDTTSVKIKKEYFESNTTNNTTINTDVNLEQLMKNYNSIIKQNMRDRTLKEITDEYPNLTLPRSYKPSYKELNDMCNSYIDILESNGLSDYEVPTRDMSYRKLSDLASKLEDILIENEIEY